MGLFGRKEQAATPSAVGYGEFDREIAEIIRLARADEDDELEDVIMTHRSRTGFTQAVLDAGIDLWAAHEYDTAFGILITLGFVDDLPIEMQAESRCYQAWCLALLDLEAEAIEAWRESAALGSVEANYLLYLHLPEGEGLTELRAAAAAGHLRAIETLAELGLSSGAPSTFGASKLGGVGMSGLSTGAEKIGAIPPSTSKLGGALSGDAGPKAAGFCVECGAQRATGAAFCGSCGGRFPA
jgi:hypothetical protein